MSRTFSAKTTEFISGILAWIIIFIGVPTVLIDSFGLYASRHWRYDNVITLHTIFQILTVVAWVAWVVCCWQLLHSIVVRVRARDTTFQSGGYFLERLAARMATVVLIITSLIVMASPGAGASPTISKKPTEVQRVMIDPQKPNPAQMSIQVMNTSNTKDPDSESSPGSQTDSSASAQVALDSSLATMAVSTTHSTAEPTYTVVTGDSLWSIATKLWGDGADWQTIASLNLGDTMDDGSVFMDPSMIRPGWILKLPSETALATSQPVSVSPPPTSLPPVPNSSPAPSTTPSTTPSPTPKQSFQVQTRVQSPQAQQSKTVVPTSLLGSDTDHLQLNALQSDPGISTKSKARHVHGPSPKPNPYPELAALGLSAFVVAALARRARRSRLIASRDYVQDSTNGLKDEPRPPTDQEIDTSITLENFATVPSLTWFEEANRFLSVSIRRPPHPGRIPSIRLLRVGPDGMDLWLDKSSSWCPDGFELKEKGDIWHLPSTTSFQKSSDLDLGNEPPWLAVVIPVGDDDSGTWLIPLSPGQCVPIFGQGAAAFLNASQLAQQCWSWHEQVLITDSPTRASDEILLEATLNNGYEESIPDSTQDPTEQDSFNRSHVLFLGDPMQLSAHDRAKCRVLSTLSTLSTDLTILVDNSAVSIHPLGITLRPNLISDDQLPVLDYLIQVHPQSNELVDSYLHEIGEVDHLNDLHNVRPADTTDITHTTEITDLTHITDTPDECVEISKDLDSPSLPYIGPGQVEVKLLTAMPRIDGLQNELPTKLARRATELIAYLALHSPDPITSDRLRTRVLGSAEMDAAAKTLFNVATAARRAMGVDSNSEAFLPFATKSGHYRIASSVTVDVERAVTIIKLARSASCDDDAIALYRAALDLIEGEPFASVLSGYAWWQGEGHEARIAKILVDAGCELARLALSGGYNELAHWALQQARLVDPYSESLSQVAMQIAATAGDVDQLRREWVECQRRADELDPGSLPSDKTERLYMDLSRRVLVS